VHSPDTERLDRAISAMSATVAADDTNAAAWHDLGILHQQRGSLAESRAAFERAVGADPSLASAHNNLGNTLHMLGYFERAVASYECALTIDRTLTAAHANAAAALHLLGRNDEALVHARAATALDPASITIRITAALIAGAAGGNEAGLSEIDELLSETPHSIAATAARAYLQLKLERYADALATAYAGLALAPENGLLLESLGCALRGVGRYVEAFATFDRAIALGHDPASLLVLKAGGQLEIGAFDDARASLERALAITPGLATAWSALCDIRSFAPGDPAIAAMETALAESPQLRAIDARTLMHFALGKAHRKARDRERAFRHFEAGNALKRATYTYDVADDEARMRETIATYTPEVMRRGAGAGDASRAPIFVIGMPRSGTTMVEQLLASHPDVYGAGEQLLFDQAVYERGTDDLAALGRRYIELIDVIAPHGKRVVDKLPSNFRHAGLIQLALPRARIIHCMRDPLDTLFSIYVTLFSGRQDFAFDQREIARYYRSYESLMAHWRTVMSPDVLLDVAYEDITADLETNARRILAFCGLPWTDAVLRFHETDRPIRTASFHQARQPIYTSSIGTAEPYRAYLQPLIDELAR
jgi:tetratricopeptide (TPR) repeat protein